MKTGGQRKEMSFHPQVLPEYLFAGFMNESSVRFRDLKAVSVCLPGLGPPDCSEGLCVNIKVYLSLRGSLASGRSPVVGGAHEAWLSYSQQ